MGFDDVIQHIGEFGRYQRRMLFILCLPAVSTSLYKIGDVFITATPDFRCLLPHENHENATYKLPSNIENMPYPFDIEKTDRKSRCERYHDFSFTNERNDRDANISSVPSTIKCDSFVYDKAQYTLTATTEWNLVCDNAWLKTLSGSLFMMGVMPGVLIFGELSDRYGRKPALLFGAILQVVCGIAVTLSPGFISFVIFRMLVASTTSGVYLVGYEAALEMVGPKKRLNAAVGVHIGYVGGYVLTPVLAYFITKWRMLYIAFSIPSLALLALWWSCSESARWLMRKDRIEEAGDILHRACFENGVKLSRNMLDGLLTRELNKIKPDLGKPSVFDLLRYPNLRKKSLILFVVWYLTSFTYWGLSWNTSSLGGNVYLNFFIAGAVEIPGHVSQLFTLDRWGRKIVLCGSLFITCLSLLPTYFVPTNTTWLLILLAMIGKLAITSAFATSYIFSAEQFPTAIRNIGVGTCSFFARLGSITAPQIIQLSEIATYFPLVIFGFASLIAGLLSWLLPETLNTKLPESIQDAEQIGSASSGKTTNRDIGKSNNGDIMKPLKEQEAEIHEEQNK